MFEKLQQLEQTYDDLSVLLSDPALLADQERYQKHVRAHAGLEEITSAFRLYKKVSAEIEEARVLAEDGADPELKGLAREEVEALSVQKEELEQQLRLLLLPKDPNDEKSVIMEIRGGTGGEEAALFVSNLYRMYTRYAERQGWKVDVMDSHPTELGGFKEIVFSIEGRGAYSRLKFESGVHRVQRVPSTEASGRIHTSAATVAVLPEAAEVEVEINPDDLRIDVYCSSGHGGQSVNTTQSAVRITHLPTGLVVTCQDEKSQHKNKDKAMRVLRSRLLEIAQTRQQDEIAGARKLMVGSGDRSERIRTYNFPQNRVTDHRVNLTLYHLDTVLEGGLDEVIQVLSTTDQAERLKRVE